MSTKMSISAADAQDMVHMHRTRSMGPKALAGHYLQYSESAIQRTLAFAKRNGFVKQLLPSSREDHRSLQGFEATLPPRGL